METAQTGQPEPETSPEPAPESSPETQPTEEPAPIAPSEPEEVTDNQTEDISQPDDLAEEEIQEPTRTTIDTGTGTLPTEPTPIPPEIIEEPRITNMEPDEIPLGIDKQENEEYPVQAVKEAMDDDISVETKEQILEEIQKAKNRNDSLMTMLETMRDTIFISKVAVFDSMLSYQQRIQSLTAQLDNLKRDSVSYKREISSLTDSIDIYRRRNSSLEVENESLWETIDYVLKEKKSLTDRINEMERTISEQRRELIYKESELSHTAPYSAAESYFNITTSGMARLPLDLYSYEGDFGFGGIGFNFRRKNLLGQHSFRKLEADFFANMFETRKEADIHASIGMWMYPWMLPWLPAVAPETEIVIDSTDFYIAGDFYTKSYIPPLDDDDETIYSITWGAKTYVPQLQTGMQILSTSFEKDYEFTSTSIGFQYRLYQSQVREEKLSAELIRLEGPQDPIIINFEVFAAYRENHMLPSTFSDGFVHTGFQKPDYDKYIGLGLTWGGNKFSYLPNLHNRLARNPRFDMMDIYPIRLTNQQMFGIYGYFEMKDDGKVERLSGDLIYHLPSIPLFECPVLLRAGIHDNGTGRWLERTVSNSLAPSGYTGLNPLEPSPKNIIEADIWLMFDKVPFGIMWRGADPMDQFPMEIGINTFFNLH